MLDEGFGDFISRTELVKNVLEDDPGDKGNSPDAESTTSNDGNPSIEIVNLFLRTDNGMEYRLHGWMCGVCSDYRC